MGIRKLDQGTEVRISSPAGTETKYPAFYRAFHGRYGRVVSQHDPDKNGLCQVLKVDISQPKDPSPTYINVGRNWVAHKHPRARVEQKRKAA